jgi:hypothetical protein
MEIPQSAKNSHTDRPFEQSSLPGYESLGRNHCDWCWRRDTKILECLSQQGEEIEQINGAIEYGA